MKYSCVSLVGCDEYFYFSVVMICFAAVPTYVYYVLISKIGAPYLP